MSKTTVFGVLISIAILSFAIYMQTVSATAFFNPAGLSIVLGGTAAAVLTSYSVRDVARVFKVFAIVIRKEQIQLNSYVNKLTKIANHARMRGLLSMQNDAKRLSNPFFTRWITNVNRWLFTGRIARNS